jgi:hypothetical protein
LRSILFFAAALTLSPLAAHADTKTVSWYVAHPITRDRVHELCMNNPGEARGNPNCLNAATAFTRSTINQIPTVTLAQICASVASEQYRRTVLHCSAGDNR